MTPQTLNLVGGVFWRTEGSEGDGDVLKIEVTIMDKDYREKIRDEARNEVVPRRMYIKKSDVEEHGYTVRCFRCISSLRGTARQEHSDACRRRLEETQKARHAKARMRQYVDRKRKKGDEEETGDVVCDKTNMEGDEPMERDKGKEEAR